MEHVINLQQAEYKKQAINQLAKIDKTALLIVDETFDILELKNVRDIQLKQVYLELIKEYLDISDCIYGPDNAEYRNIFLVFDCFDLRQEVDIRYTNYKNKIKTVDFEALPTVRYDKTNCVNISDFKRQKEYEETIPDQLSSGYDFSSGTDTAAFVDIHPEYVSTTPEAVVLVGDDQRAFAFKDDICCGEITTEEQLKKVKEEACGKDIVKQVIKMKARRTKVYNGPSLFE